jgi:hypothetical protein
MIARLFLALALVALLAACGSQPDSGSPDVATLASGPAPAATPTARDDHPLIRPDTSQEELDRMYAAYNRCLKEHGLDVKQPKAADAAAPSRMAAAEQQCEQIRPEQLWERAKRTDPAYADKLHEWVKCVRAFGIDATEADGRLTLTVMPTDEQLEKINECQTKAFSPKAG